MESVEYTSYYSKKTTIRNFMGIPFKENVEKKALIFVEDITKIKKAEEEMKRAMAIRSQFISMVSHELRTPLAAIKGGVDLILSEKKGPLNKEQKEFLDISKRNVDRLARLINSVLDYQKLDAGRMEFNMEKDDINELISDVSKQMEPLIKEKGLVLRISLGTDTPRINFDKDKIEQVLMNLINNALKFTEKGSITISSSKLNNAVCVSVADTGIGIRKEDMDKLFLSFSQIATGKERKTGGTGLGLAISKKILREHHGKIRAQSESGAGSKFSFFLPIRERRG
jgi:polar amino acid transport system substrate-binding protein